METPKKVHGSPYFARSSAFWKEPKDLLLTLFACSLASLTQGLYVLFSGLSSWFWSEWSSQS